MNGQVVGRVTCNRETQVKRCGKVIYALVFPVENNKNEWRK